MKDFIDYFIVEYKPDVSIMAFDGEPLTNNTRFLREADYDQIGNLRCHRTYSVLNGAKIDLLAEDFSQCHFYELEVFLATYRVEGNLPFITPRKYDFRSSSEIRKCLELLVRPVQSQKEFIERLREASKLIIKNGESDPRYLDVESFNGISSSAKTLSGVPADLDMESYFYVKFISGKKYWEVFTVERGVDTKRINIYKLENVYEFILNANILRAI